MKIKLTNKQMEGVIRALEDAKKMIVQSWPYSDDEDVDNLIIAVYEEMSLHLQTKFLTKKEKYNITIKPTWGFAIRWFYAGVERNTYETNIMGMISDEVHRVYSSKEKLLGHENS